MDRGKVSAVTPYLPEPVAAPSIEQLYSRLGMYWRALGVHDPERVAQLSEAALQRAATLPIMPDADPMARAIAAAGELLDAQLAQVLGQPQSARALTAARAALLSGAVPDGVDTLFASSGATGAMLEELRAALAESTPEPSPSAMPAQRIELFSLFGPVLRLWRR